MRQHHLGSSLLIPRYMSYLTIFFSPKASDKLQSQWGIIIFVGFSVRVGEVDCAWIGVGLWGQTKTSRPCAASLCISDCHAFIKCLLECIWILSLTRCPPRHMIKNLSGLRVSGLLTSEEQTQRSRLIWGDLHMHIHIPAQLWVMIFIKREASPMCRNVTHVHNRWCYCSIVFGHVCLCNLCKWLSLVGEIWVWVEVRWLRLTNHPFGRNKFNLASTFLKDLFSSDSVQ